MVYMGGGGVMGRRSSWRGVDPNLFERDDKVGDERERRLDGCTQRLPEPRGERAQRARGLLHLGAQRLEPRRRLLREGAEGGAEALVDPVRGVEERAHL